MTQIPASGREVGQTIAQKKVLGAFYTPDDVARTLCEWAVRAPSDTVLEPSFGGCGFLDASMDVLRALGSANPLKNIYGCDIDTNAFATLWLRYGSSIVESNFVKSDFLETSLSSFGRASSVDVVIGNPPYISFDKLLESQKEWMKSRHLLGETTITGRPSLWAHFVLHGARFLRVGGRMAWVLPGSFSSAHYARQLHKWLREEFSRVLVIALAERLFVAEGTEETTVVVLADGFQEANGAGRIRWKYCDGARELTQAIASWGAGGIDSDAEFVDRDLPLSAEFMEAYEQARVKFAALSLGDIAHVKIGLVSGDTRFFIRSDDAWRDLKMPKSCLHTIMPKSKWVKGINASVQHLTAIAKLGVPCTMFSPSKALPKGVSVFLAQYPLDQREANVTFAKRPLWYAPDDRERPDLFGVFMTHLGPRLILNTANTNATNAYYRIYGKRPLRRMDAMLLSISFLSTVTQFAAEITGRVRGAGALKLEPSEFRVLPVFLPNNRSYSQVKRAFLKIDRLLRLDQVEAARSCADSLLFGQGLVARELLAKLNAGAKIARARRMRSKAD